MKSSLIRAIGTKERALAFSEAEPGSVRPSIPSEPMLLGDAPARQADRRRALVLALLLVLAFSMTASSARVPLPALPVFVPIHDALIVTLDLLTALLLHAQYRKLRVRSFLALACGYLFTPALVLAHAASFPDAFGAGRLIGGSQTTAWLWVWGHGSFPVFVIAYALFARREREQRSCPGLARTRRSSFGAHAQHSPASVRRPLGRGDVARSSDRSGAERNARDSSLSARILRRASVWVARSQLRSGHFAA